jgi:shikimate dehydrogenase
MKNKFAVFGHPVSHSLSPAIHQAFAQQLGLEIEYKKIDPGPDGFQAALTAFREQGGRGASVTLPFKQEAMQLASVYAPAAQASGAANTLWWNNAGELMADNTDGLGLVWDLQQRLSVVLKGARILLVGAGGAAAGILPSLLVEHPKTVYVANRTVEKAEELVARQAPVFSNALEAVSLEAGYQQPLDLIIQATSLGHKGSVVALPESAFGPNTFCYDLSYGHAAQPFLEWAAERGMLYRADGIGMLVAQAAQQCERWHSKTPDLRKTLQKISLFLGCRE